MTLIQYAFWLLFFILVYVYIGFPLLLYILSKIFNKKIEKGSYQPTVSLLIAAYNEEKSILRTIENKLDLDYPKEKLEIIEQWQRGCAQ